jgi:trimeric autotransporter adhesin
VQQEHQSQLAYSNTLIGGLAGDGFTSSANNTAVGYLALSANAGDSNTAVGLEALKVYTGQNSTAIGKNAGNASSSGNGNIFVGKDAGLTGSPGGAITSAGNTAVFGDENISACHIQTDWTVASDQRDKTDFTALDLGLDFVKALAPVTYKWDKRSMYGDKTADDYDLAAQTPDGTHKEDWLDVGFKAQEVEALEKAAGYKIAEKSNLTTSLTSDGKQYGIQYTKFVPILVKAIQEQNALIEALTARVATLEG